MPLPHLEAFVDAEKLIIAGSEIWELSPLAKTTSSVLRLAENSNGEKRVLKAVEKIYGQGAFGKRGFGERELDVSHKLDEYPDYRDTELFRRLHGWFEDSKSVYLLLEYVKLGPLVSDRGKFAFYESDIKEITVQILKGLSIMHKHEFAHRDIKPDNILLASRFPVRIKICDFGISRPLTNGTSYTNTGHSTIIYAAPEVHGFDSNGPEDRNRPAVDLWSLGCVIYELVVGQSLFRNLEDVRKFYNDQLGGLKRAQKKLNNGISKEGIQFFSKLLQVSYEDRPTTTQALNHPWLSQKVQHLTMVRALPVQFSERIYLASVPEQREELVRKARESLSKNVDIRAIHALEKWWRSASSQMLYIIDQSSSDAGSLVGLASLEAAPNYVIAYFGNHRTPPDERNSLTDLTSSLVRQLDHCLDTDPDNLDYHYPFFDQAVSGIRERIGRLPAQDRLLVIFDGFQHLDKTLSQAEKKNISSLITVLTSIDSRTNVTIKLLLVTPGPTRILSPPIVPGKQTVDINNKILSSGPLHPELRRIYRLV